MKWLRNKLIYLLIWFIEKELAKIPNEVLQEEQTAGLMSQLWYNQAFRNYILDRDRKLIWTIAGGAGMDPEPRDKYLMKFGQRVELLILAARCKSYAERKVKDREKVKASLKEEQK